MIQKTEYINREQALNCVGQGWATLINKAYDVLDTYPTLKVIQVKEKWGGLRIYTDGYIPEVDKIIIELEKSSYNICEVCGAAGNLRGGGWYRTLCEEHANGKAIIQPF